MTRLDAADGTFYRDASSGVVQMLSPRDVFVPFRALVKTPAGAGWTFKFIDKQKNRSVAKRKSRLSKCSMNSSMHCKSGFCTKPFVKIRNLRSSISLALHMRVLRNRIVCMILNGEFPTNLIRFSKCLYRLHPRSVTSPNLRVTSGKVCSSQFTRKTTQVLQVFCKMKTASDNSTSALARPINILVCFHSVILI